MKSMSEILKSNMLREEFKDIKSRSHPAVCGAFEREVIVSNSQVAKTKAILKAMGMIIVGTGKAGFNSTKIWFNPAGVSL